MADARPGWLLDELAFAGRENLDAAHVARYDAKEDADAVSEVALLTSLGLGSGSVLVDIGAGTGQLTCAAARLCARVIAVDVSEAMLARLRAKAPPNVEVVQAGFLSYEHRGEPVDFVYSRYALHHLPDFWKAVALARMGQMLKSRGVLRLWDVVFGFEPAEVEQRVEAWCATGGDDVEAEWLRTELEEHVRDEHSTFTWLLEPTIERAGFAIEDVVYSDDRVFAKYVLRRTS